MNMPAPAIKRPALLGLLAVIAIAAGLAASWSLADLAAAMSTGDQGKAGPVVSKTQALAES